MQWVYRKHLRELVRNTSDQTFSVQCRRGTSRRDGECVVGKLSPGGGGLGGDASRMYFEAKIVNNGGEVSKEAMARMNPDVELEAPGSTSPGGRARCLGCQNSRVDLAPIESL
eukprot:scaffold188655_cov35-Tisochrysis_lutea.AAC.1